MTHCYCANYYVSTPSPPDVASYPAPRPKEIEASSNHPPGIDQLPEQGIQIRRQVQAMRGRPDPPPYILPVGRTISDQPRPNMATAVQALKSGASLSAGLLPRDIQWLDPRVPADASRWRVQRRMMAAAGAARLAAAGR